MKVRKTNEMFDVLGDYLNMITIEANIPYYDAFCINMQDNIKLPENDFFETEIKNSFQFQNGKRVNTISVVNHLYDKNLFKTHVIETVFREEDVFCYDGEVYKLKEDYFLCMFSYDGYVIREDVELGTPSSNDYYIYVNKYEWYTETGLNGEEAEKCFTEFCKDFKSYLKGDI